MTTQPKPEKLPPKLCPRECTECDGEQQHSTPGYECKHCEVWAAMCDECDEPIFPATSSVCAECREAGPQ